MARLFSRMSAGAIDDPDFGHFEPDGHGGFDLPDVLSDRIGRVCHRGRRLWETETERDDRLHGEESARRQDPATLLAAVEKIVGASERPAAGGQSAEIDALKAQVAALTEAVAAARAKPARKAPAARA